ncbi:MAG TPA: GGDEF domain-containing protein [Acidiferrobacter sp.]|nr:GGDEF domain-containing protein [Acidiferrobacter sp.]
MGESPQDPSTARTDQRARLWTHPFSDFFAINPSEFASIIDTDQHSVVFQRQRARFILLRIRLIAVLFAALTSLWIPVDMLTFQSTVWQHLAYLRLGASIAFVILVWYSGRVANMKHAYRALATLFLLPLVFFLLSHALLLGVPLDRIGMIAASSYTFLPFVLVAGISVFPLTVKESAALMVPIIAVAAVPLVARHAFMMPHFEGLAVLWLLAVVAAVGSLSAVSHLQLMHTLFAQSVIDPLTGAFNRSSGAELIGLQLALARRHHYPLTIAFADLDDFKKVNDTAGHSAGDELLTQAAQAFRAMLRESDALIRWGGEEFVLLLPHTDCVQACTFLRNRCPALQKPNGTTLTYSIGVAEWIADDRTRAASLVALADRRMYQAKAEGKARIIGCGSDNYALQPQRAATDDAATDATAKNPLHVPVAHEE